MEQKYQIDNYSEGDYETVTALWEETGIRAISREAIAGIVAHGGRLIVARDQVSAGAVGTVMWTFDGERAVVRKVAVHPDYRRNGIAQSLVKEACRQIKEAGIRNAILFTGVDNVAAQSLYAKIGWVVDDRSVQVWRMAP